MEQLGLPGIDADAARAARPDRERRTAEEAARYRASFGRETETADETQTDAPTRADVEDAEARTVSERASAQRQGAESRDAALDDGVPSLEPRARRMIGEVDRTGGGSHLSPAAALLARAFFRPGALDELLHPTSSRWGRSAVCARRVA